MRPRLSALAGLCACAALLLSSPARAQIGITARTAGMGGAGVATARGGEGIYYNPATTTRATVLELSASANAYGFSRLVYHDFDSYTDDLDLVESADAISSGVSALPVAATTVLPFQTGSVKHTFGVGAFVPISQRDEFVTNLVPIGFPVARDARADRDQSVYWFSGSYAIDFGPLSLGAAAHLQVSQFKDVWTSFQARPDSSDTLPLFLAFSTSVDGQGLDALFDLGAKLHLGKLGLGVAVRTPTFHLGGNARISTSLASSNTADGTSLTTTRIEDADGQFPVGLAIDVGVAYDSPKDLVLTVDVGIVPPYTFSFVSFETVEEGGLVISPEDYEFENELRVELRMGLEWWLSDRFAVRTGFWMQPFNGFPELASEEDVRQVRDGRVDGSVTNTEARELLGTNISTFAATLGCSYVIGNGQVDFGMNAGWYTGANVSTGLQLLGDGTLIDTINRGDVDGFFVTVYFGGSFGIDVLSERQQLAEQESSMLQPEARPAGGTDAGKPDAGKPDAGKPGAVEPDSGKPGVGNPGAVEPDVGKPGPSRLGAVEPDSGKPGVVEPDPGKPDPGKPGAAEPDSGRSEAGGKPSAGNPEGQSPTGGKEP